MYWLSKQLNISFSPYEDRLVLRAKRSNQDIVNVLLTRRMVIIILKRLVTSLPQLTGLEKMPAQYWKEVLQMAHQKAMQAKHDADKAHAASAQHGSAATKNTAATNPPRSKTPKAPIYLATELKTQLVNKELTLAFNGLPMPQAMTVASAHEPIFAAPMQADHVHQMIELLIAKANEAQWHLPVNLPWLDNPSPGGTTSLGDALLH